MHRRLVAVLAFAAALAALAQQPGSAQQGQLPLPGFKPPPPAPIKPYQPVAVTPPPAMNDPSFTAFRNQLGEVAAHKDRAALAKMVVTQNFFWMQDKNSRRPAQIRYRQSGQGRRTRCAGRFGLANTGRLRDRTFGGGIAATAWRVLRAGRSQTRFERSGSAGQSNADRSERMGLSKPERRRGARGGAAELASYREARRQSGARAARHQPARQSQPAVFPARSDAVR